MSKLQAWLREYVRVDGDTPPSDKEALDTAWKIHAALVDWTGKVDAKASFAVTLESAGIATIVALSSKDRIFGALTGHLQLAAYYGALGCLIVAASLAMWVVIPRLRMWKVRKEAPENFIYFGHLQYWEPLELAEKIKTAEMLPVIAKQMVGMSEIAWRKHLFVKASMILAIVGGGCLLACGLLIRNGLAPF